jgi:hypothetical protein
MFEQILEDNFIEFSRIYRMCQDMVPVIRPWEADAERCMKQTLAKPEAARMVELRPTPVQCRARSNCRKM